MTSYGGRAAKCVGHKPLHYNYRLSCREFDALVLRAEGRCDRCGAEMQQPRIEHDHVIGRHGVRGLTCNQCNLRIAAVERGFRDNDELTMKYLASPFHRSIPEVVPVLRPAGFDAERPRNLRDPNIYWGVTRDLLTIAQAAELLGVTRKEVRLYVERGQLLGFGIGSRIRFRRVVVERVKLLLEQRTEPAFRAELGE